MNMAMHERERSLKSQPTLGRYLESQILTASPEQLVVILYDGAIRFCRRAEEAMAAGNLQEAGDLLVRAQRVVLELLCALKPEADAQLAGSLAGLYTFLYEELVWANVEAGARRVQGVVKVLETLREGWAGAAERVRRGESAS